MQDIEIAKLKASQGRSKKRLLEKQNLDESELEEDIKKGVKERGMAEKWEDDAAHAFYDGLVANKVQKKKKKPAAPLPF